MKPFVMYALARFGLFLVSFGLVWLVCFNWLEWNSLNLLWTMLIALALSAIVGVVVLIREGSDRETDEAASAVMEALRAAGFNVAKGNWPADLRRFRGTLNGPQTPGPTDAPIRIVIGSKAR
ncbi:MAG: DUF4229 domain-containing protein [Actinomycetia bacterium]|nr:DUF4229 domain-containing protein [Actinomycetes bacterium]